MGEVREYRILSGSLDDKGTRDCLIEGNEIKKSIVMPCLASSVAGHLPYYPLCAYVLPLNF